MRGLKETLLAVTLVAGCGPDPTAGVYRVDGVEGCLGLRVGGNVVVPYGLESIDCESSRAVLESIASESLVSVRAGECRLVGLGQAARFKGDDCNPVDSEGQLPEAVARGGVPVRDEAGQIHASIDRKGKHGVGHGMAPVDSKLMSSGSVRPTADCIAKSTSRNHYCVGIVSNWARLEDRAER